MDLYAFPPIAALLDLASAGITALATVLAPVAGAGSAALAVVVITLLVRAALIPTGIAQARAEQVRARLAPQLRELQNRHRRDPERLRRETMQLYRDEDASPLAGCLPVLIQAPIVGILYATFILPTISGHPNDLLAQTLFGVPLGASPLALLGGGTMDAASAAVFSILILLIAAVGEVTRRLFPVAPTPADPEARADPESPRPSPPASPAGLLGALQFATAVVAMFVPLAAGLYLLVTVVWTLGQRLVLRRLYPPVHPPAA